MKECITFCYFFPKKNFVILFYVKLQSYIIILSEAVRNFYVIEIFMHQKHISKFIGGNYTSKTTLKLELIIYHSLNLI